MSDPYDLRSNLKNKPGAQGTLFQVKDKGLLNPAQRWPQGYTPERLNEVRDALKTTPVSAPVHMQHANPTQMQKALGVNDFGFRERVNREVAKSTVPVEDLAGLKRIGGDPDEGTHGTYHYPARTLDADMTASKRDSHETLIHEIGHHVDFHHGNESLDWAHDVAPAHARKALEGNEWRSVPNSSDIASAQSKILPGVREAVADNYMVKHARPGGRKAKAPEKGAYEQTFTPGQRDASYPGYNDVRTPHHGAEAALQESQFNPGLFPQSEASGQQSPLQRRLAARADATRHAVGDNL